MHPTARGAMYYGHQPTCRRPILSPRRVIVIVAFDKDPGLTALMMDEVSSIDEQAVDRLIRHNVIGCRLANLRCLTSQNAIAFKQ